jgi:hypothetical protein
MNPPLAGEQTTQQQATPVQTPVAKAEVAKPAFRVDNDKARVALRQILAKYETTPAGKESVSKAVELVSALPGTQVGMTPQEEIHDWEALVRAGQFGRAIAQVKRIHTSKSGSIGRHTAYAMTSALNALKDGSAGATAVYRARHAVVAC